MLDVHVAVSETTHQRWLAKCLDSVSEAIECAMFPVTLHLVPGVPGHIGMARANGYSKGAAPYVTYVDDDDWVDREFFAAMLPALQCNPDAIFLREFTHTTAPQPYVDSRRHCRAVYRRALTEAFDWNAWRCVNDSAFRRTIERQPGIYLDLIEPHYHWRQGCKSQGKVLIERFHDEANRLRELIRG